MTPAHAFFALRPASAAAAVLFLLVSATAGHAQQTVTFAPSPDATGSDPTPEIDGQLFKPDGDGPFPALVAMHGCSGPYTKTGRLKARETDWARLFTAKGYVVLFPDSFGPRHVGDGCGTGAPEARPWAERVRDAYGALFYLQNLPFVAADRIGLLGWSHGGGTVLFTAGVNTKARPPQLPKGDFRAAVSFYPGWCKPAYQGESWTTIAPLLVLVGEDDDWIQAGTCIRTITSAAERGVQVTLKTYPGAYHDFDWPGLKVHTQTPRPGLTVHVGTDPAAREDALLRVPNFFDRYLKDRK